MHIVADTYVVLNEISRYGELSITFQNFLQLDCLVHMSDFISVQ